jgi:oligopeptide transport system substrate-binding protein
MSLKKYLSAVLLFTIVALMLAACGDTATSSSTTTSAAGTTAAGTTTTAATTTSSATTTAATTTSSATTTAAASTAAGTTTAAASTAAGTATTTAAAGSATAGTSGGTSASIPTAPAFPGKTVAGSVINFREPDDIPASDPALIQDQTSIEVFQNVYDGLTQFATDGKTVVPDIASSWDISSDGLVYTFHLRKDVKFSNGDPVTAQDFIYSWTRLLENPNAPYGYVFDSIKGLADAADANITDTAKLKAYVEQNMPNAVQAPDQYTLKITLAQPASFFLAETALWSYWVVDKNVVEKFADPTNKDPLQQDKDLNSRWAEAPNNGGGLVGTGAYTLDSWAHDQKLVLKANPNYFGGAPGAAEVDVNIIKDDATALQQFNSGKIDIYQLADFTNYKKLKSDPNIGTQLQEVPGLRVTYLGLNATKGPFAGDAALPLRQALSYGINKQAIIDSALNGAGYPANSLLVGVPGDAQDSLPCYSDYDPYKYDASKAKQLLAQAGYSSSDKLTQLGQQMSPYTFNTSNVNAAIAQNIQAQLKQTLGINITLANTTFKEFLTKRQNHEYISYRDSWGADYPDPQDFLQPLAGTGQPENNEGWTNKQYDDLVAKGNSAANLQDRCTSYQAANKIYIDQAVTVPLFFGKNVYLVSKRVTNWKINPLQIPKFGLAVPSGS